MTPANGTNKKLKKYQTPEQTLTSTMESTFLLPKKKNIFFFF